MILSLFNIHWVGLMASSLLAAQSSSGRVLRTISAYKSSSYAFFSPPFHSEIRVLISIAHCDLLTNGRHALRRC